MAGCYSWADDTLHVSGGGGGGASARKQHIHVDHKYFSLQIEFLNNACQIKLNELYIVTRETTRS